MSNWLENKIIDWLLRGQSYTPPTTVYIALFSSSPSDPTGGTEVSGNNYARASVASNMTNWAGTSAPGNTFASSGSDGTTSNNAAIGFNTPSGSWGVVSYFGLYDQASGGNLLFWGALNGSKTVFSGDAVSVGVGLLQIQIDD